MKNRYDRLFVIILAGIILLLFLYQHFMTNKGAYIQVSLGGEAVGIYDLSKNQTFDVVSDGGSYNTITIQDGQVWVEEADCPDKLCVKQGKIFRAGQSIICLPHKLTVLVCTDSEQEVDAVVQ